MVRIMVYCPDCDAQVEADAGNASCPFCGGFNTRYY